MMNDYTLELGNVFQTGEVESGTYVQKLLGSVKTALVLKDVSFEVHGGEVMAILGSKGSGKRALLETISRRSQGSRRGRVLLNGVPMTLNLFQESCAYVCQKCDFIPGLTLRQTLEYQAMLTIGKKISGSLKRKRVKEVIADLALSDVANRTVDQLTASECRRLMIGLHLIRDPVVILLDEPTWDLDPLNTFFIVSILSNHAKKYNRIVILTMEKPRSDLFSFLDRVTYLCLGDVVYTGSTRMMLDYFRNIGFPCPELENPLMYYLFLSTVDRRSRERFLESNNQIMGLVERFKLEGGPYTKFNYANTEMEVQHKIPLAAFGQPTLVTTVSTLIRRYYSNLFNCKWASFRQLYLKLFLIPTFFFFIWLFYFNLSNYQHSFVTRNGLLFSSLCGVSYLSAAISSVTYAPHRTRYFQESREGMYRPFAFLLSQNLASLPLSLMSVFAGSAIIYSGTGLNPSWVRWVLFSGVLWACYGFVEQQTIALMLIVRSSFTAIIINLMLCTFYITSSSGMVRTLIGISDWLYYLSYTIVFRYAGAFLNENEFRNNLKQLPSSFSDSLTVDCFQNNAAFGCRYQNGTLYLSERYYMAEGDLNREDLNYYLDFGICFTFLAGMGLINFFLYYFPLPAFLKSKFRE